MLGVGYRKVNQDQSSDPPALFRTSKAYSSLFSQHTLAAISAVSPDKALYMCVTVCVSFKKKSYEFQESATSIHTHLHTSVFSHMNSPTYMFWGMSLISHLLTQGVV